MCWCMTSTTARDLNTWPCMKKQFQMTCSNSFDDVWSNNDDEYCERLPTNSVHQKESSYSKYSTKSWCTYTTYKTSSTVNIYLKQVPRTCSFDNIASWMGLEVNTVWVWTSLDNIVSCFKSLRWIRLMFLQEAMLDFVTLELHSSICKIAKPR